MRRRGDIPELLAPAGDIDALYAAVAAGADAVYIGGEQYGARAYAKNFTREEIRLAVRYCHAAGVRLFVTVNTLIFDKELAAALEYCEYLASVGVDALIVCDLGLISELRKRLPTLELHASTQLGVHNTSGADFAFGLGLRRVVLARECSLRDINEICKKSHAECEIFVHGALCVCHSGQCLFSSMVGGRSGNRGECAQPCRLPYNGGHPLSLKDLSLALHIPSIIDSGAASLKIEGRMKSAAYVFGVVSIYRRLLDERRAATQSELRRLAEIFSRGGFTDGYFVEKLSSMTGVRSEQDKQNSRESAETAIEFKKIPIRMSAELALDRPSELTLSVDIGTRVGDMPRTLSVRVAGKAPTAAISAPLTAEGVAQRLMKLGGTRYTVTKEAVTVVTEEGINMPPSAINELRRSAVELLEEEFAKPLSVLLGTVPDGASECALPTPPRIASLGSGCVSTATLYGVGLYSDLSRRAPEVLSRFDASFIPLDAFRDKSLEVDVERIGVILPPIIMPREWETVRRELEAVRDGGVRLALVSNIGHIALASELGFVAVGDIGLNVANGKSAELLRSLGIKNLLVSPELTLPQARDIGEGVTVYGRIPLMITERCATKECEGCGRCGSFSLEDRYGERFPILPERGHRSRIFNSRPTCTSDRQDELRSYGISKRHFIFSSESAEQVISVISLYDSGARADFPVRRIGKR